MSRQENRPNPRLSVNGVQLVDDWENGAPRTTCGTIDVRAGWYPMELEYYEATGGATLSLLRGTSASDARPVPSFDLCCTR